MDNSILDQLVIENDNKIVFLIMDGLGGLQSPGKAGTELQAANCPNLDQLAQESVCGLLDPILPGVTPGSGPAHFALFGYDPIQFNIGRGVLSAAGVEFDLTSRDLAARVNFCTLDRDGNVTDRRAGRIATELNAKLFEEINYEGNTILNLQDKFDFAIPSENRENVSNKHTLKEHDRWDHISEKYFNTRDYSFWIWIWNDIIHPERYLSENIGKEILIPNPDYLISVINEIKIK